MSSSHGLPAPAHGSSVVRAHAGRRAAALLAVLLAALGVSLLAAPAASAHTELESSDPADGSVVQVVPTAVSLTFSESLVDLEPVLIVTGPDGQPQQSGAVRLEGAVLGVDLAPLTVPGAYTVAYRVVSADGHPVEGQVAFALDAAALAPVAAAATSAPAAPPPTAAPTVASESGPPSATGTPSPAASAAASSSGSAAAPAPAPTTATVAATSAESSGPSGWLWVAVIAAVALLSVGGVVIARRRARQV